MENIVEIEYLDIEGENYDELIDKVIEKCFKVEKLDKTKLYVSVTLTTPDNIKRINKDNRNIDKVTDVLSFPFYERNEIIAENFMDYQDILGDIVICVDKVKSQAIEYGHSFERELAYMLVHGFYHIIGYDHIEEADKKIMRAKEEAVLNELKFVR